MPRCIDCQQLTRPDNPPFCGAYYCFYHKAYMTLEVAKTEQTAELACEEFKRK